MTSQRLPAYPLIACDPGFSIWTRSDLLSDAWPTHWTGYVRGSCLMVRIDGMAYAVMGPCTERKAEQRSRQVLPTRTIYVLQAGAVELTVTFLNPLLPDDLDVLSRPLAYVIVGARSTDGVAHAVQLYLDIGGEWATDTGDQEVVWCRPRIGGIECMKIGSASQRVLARSGDNIRTDWGHCWLAVAADGRQCSAVQPDAAMRCGWAADGRLPKEDDQAMPRGAFTNRPQMGAMIDLGLVTGGSEGSFIVAYEDVWAVEFMQRRIRPYWQRSGLDFASMLKDALARQDELRARCVAFDADLLSRCEAAGGAAYRDLCAATYRQAVAAHKLGADFDGSPLFFSKENFSNGCIATVDVTYPSAPLFLLVNPTLLEGMVTPVLQYAASPRWRFPFAPHDLGTFPLANGQVYGGGEVSERDQMPVEECGNMLLLVAAICRARGSAAYAAGHWKLVRQWAGYLIDKGLDPENQLCTDDFAGHLAHNTNLSIKAILGIGAAARIAGQLGHAADAAAWRSAAEGMATRWIGMAKDTGHYRLTFDGAGSWSQKYNLVWDRLLGLDLFPASVAREEIASYLKRRNHYGLPLDSRKTYTKNDWILWTASLAERRADFEALITPVLRWLAEAPDRNPMTDWYDTVSGRQEGFQARSVVGGMFIQALAASPAFSRTDGDWSLRAGVSSEGMASPALPGHPCSVSGAPAAHSVWLAAPARILAAGEGFALSAADWTPRYLVIDLRLRASECAMLRLSFRARGGGEPFVVMLGLLPGLRVRLSLDLNILDGQRVFLPRHPGLLKGVAFGRRLAREDIVGVDLSLDDAKVPQEVHVGQPHLSLVDAPWVDADAPQVDALGQWLARDWPGRTRNEEEMVGLLRAAAVLPDPGWPAGRSRFGGDQARRHAATGWFRTHHDGRRWWLVDPEGCAFWSAGLDCVRPNIDCAVVPGTEPLYAWLPSSDPVFAAAARPGRPGVPAVDFGVANLIRAFGADWMVQWRHLTATRLRSWGFNTIGNWSDAEIGPRHGIPWVMPMPAYPTTAVKLFRDLPDVFDPTFATAAGTWAQALVAVRDDPWLIGYFMANEPQWGFGRFNLAAEMLEANPGTHSRRALAAWLAERYAGDVAAWSRAWGMPLADFAEVVTRTFRRIDAASPRAGEDLWAFSAELVRRHARIPADACRQVDPNHLNLGLRWAWIASELFYESAAVCDVFSINCYQMLPDAGEFAGYARRSGRPVMIGEWHMGAVDRGLPSTGLRGVADQHERGVAYRAYIEACAAHSDIIGAHYFTLNDQAVLGRFDGENYQIGFVDGCHRPYPEICAAAIASHARLPAIVGGSLAPTAERAREVPKIAF